MAARAQVIPALIAAGVCAILLRSLLEAGAQASLAFVGPRNAVPDRAALRHCRLAGGGSDPALLTSEVVPALISGTPARQSASVGYRVTLETPDGTKELDCEGDVYILDKAEAGGLVLPYSCRVGACSTCAGKVLSGSVDQSAQVWLEEDDLAAGYCLMCVALPTSDVTIR